MNLGDLIEKSNKEEIAQAIKKSILNNKPFDNSVILRFQSQDAIPCDYYSFVLGNVEFTDCFVYPCKKARHYKGILDRIKIKVEAEK